ncbi:Ig-like, group 2 [Candidatus Koribacter versatilis Ellin345]|uniref:Ig-like, group 2 n=1 Tax=Koribacter versatilis (strain Ellin345) TaxID=204669 RepID=Q1ILL9_KORVE|nr:Ig-like domain repeat protein [Candidatus Koribacter versatilis]ABF42231.1 Ig-like, group 2 [Candidatus Koribacter versatilis Ellin345]
MHAVLPRLAAVVRQAFRSSAIFQTIPVLLLASVTATAQSASSNVLFSNPNPSRYGQSVTFTDQVFSTGLAPTGTVTFNDGGSTLGAGAVATITTADNSLGFSETPASWFKTAGVTLTANAGGAPNGTNTATQVVYNGAGAAGSYRVYVNSSPNTPTVSGQTYTASVWVKAAAPIALRVSANVGTPAACNVTTTWTRCAVTATGNGTSLKQFLIYSAASSNATFSIFVWGAQYETGTVTGPYVSTSGTGVTNGTAYVAALTTSVLTAGAHSITAAYSGDSNFNPSTSQILLHTVNSGNSFHGLYASVNPTAYGQSVTFTDQVFSNGAEPTGTITFNDGDSSIGGGAVTITSGNNSLGYSESSASWFKTAGVTLTANAGAAPNGTNTATQVAYNGAGTAGSYRVYANSSPNTPTVSGQIYTASVWVKATTPIALRVFANVGAAAPCNVTTTWTRCAVTATGNGTALKQFLLYSAASSNTAFSILMWGAQYETGNVAGPYVVTTGTGVTNAIAYTATLTTPVLTAGTHPITGAYDGDSNYSPSNSPTISQVVGKVTPTVALTCSPNPSGNGQSVTCTATLPNNAVSANSATIQFKDNGSNLGSPIAPPDLSATYTTSNFSVGTHSIVAAYSGNLNYNAANSATVSQVVSSQAAPSITSLSVTSGVVGTLVTINGNNFGSTPTVTFFNGVTAAVTSSSGTQIHTSVPNGATSGNVVVTTTSNLISNGRNFTVLPTPTVSGATPMYGVAGVPVVISGTNFGNTQGGSQISFNGTPATASSWGPNRIVVPVPAGAPAGSGPLTLRVSGVNFNLGTFKVQTISSLAVSPTSLTLPQNSVQRFVALATYSDATTQNITPAATWTSSNTSVLTVDSTGLYTAVGQGQSMIQATYGATSSNFVTVNVGAPSFVPVGSLHDARQNHAATLLQDGTVLVTGGQGSSNGSGFPLLRSAELYDPVATSFTLTGVMNQTREFHTATLLSNGKVLIAGGQTQGTGLYMLTATAELYDPSTSTFTPTGKLNHPRAFHTATLLSNGQVLIAGGEDENGPSTSAELYDPASGSFTPTNGNMTNPGGGAAVALNDGTVLFIEDASATGVNLEVFDPATGMFTATIANGFAGDTAVLLSSGNVLNYGLSIYDGESDVDIPSAQVCNAGTKVFSAVGDLSVARTSSPGTRLSNGKVVVIGGFSQQAGAIGDAEVYDPTSQTFLGAGSLNTPRWLHTATLLNDGTVLITGGAEDAGPLSSAEVYQAAP